MARQHISIHIQCMQPSASVRLTWKVEAAIPVAFGRGVGWWCGTGRIALLEGCRRGGCGRGGGGRVAAGIQLIQHRRMILLENRNNQE